MGQHLAIAGTPMLSSSIMLDGGLLTINNLSISGSGQLDLTDNDLVMDYASASPANQIRQLIVAGRNGGSWNGNGIISSAAAAAPRMRRR